MDNEAQIISHLTGIGITEQDAIVITDCIVTRKSCSWVNTDPVDEKMLQDLRDLIEKRGYRIMVKIDQVPTRSKYIWEVKVLQ